MVASSFEEPPLDCPRCPRLVGFRHELQGHVAREYQARHEDTARSRGGLPNDDDDGEYDDDQA